MLRSLCLFVFTVVFTMVTVVSASAGMNMLEKEVAAVELTRDVKRGGYELISTAELKARIDSGEKMLIVDTMPYEESYKKAHVPGAKQFLFPTPDMKEWKTDKTGGKTIQDYKKLLGTNKMKTIVVYCGSVKCTRSHNGVIWAKRLGYNNVMRYSGGINAWKGAGYKTDSAE